MSKLKTVLLILLLGLAIALAGFIIWAETPLGPMPEALAALETDSAVRVQTQPWLEFWPPDREPAAGIIIYPGGRVDPRSYAPTARALAEEGYLAVITPMPLNLAVFESGAAADVIAAYPEIETWVVGGHSLGGTMAATYAGANAGTVDGLALWASYPADDVLATHTEPDVLSIYATNDGLSTLQEIDASRADLPPQTRWVEIAGGNHAQFGWYGEQPGDGQATISRPDQQAQIVAATADLLERLTAAEAGR
ncbi:MAG: alpha/beta hydrolase [Chloroflexota bacterium]